MCHATTCVSLRRACAAADHCFDQLSKTRGCCYELQPNAASQDPGYVKQLDSHIQTLAAWLRLRLTTCRDHTRGTKHMTAAKLVAAVLRLRSCLRSAAASGIIKRSEKLPLTCWGFAWKRDLFGTYLEANTEWSERVKWARNPNSDDYQREVRREVTRQDCE